jgi:hypothetical protein
MEDGTRSAIWYFSQSPALSIRFPIHAHSLGRKKIPPHYAVVVWFIAMSPSLLENLQFGVIEIGSFVGVFLLGVLFLQTFNYYNMFPDDGWVNKTLVRSEVISSFFPD